MIDKGLDFSIHFELLMERQLYREAGVVPYRLPFEDDIFDLRVRAEFDRNFRQLLLRDDYFYAIFKRKYTHQAKEEPVSPAQDVALWIMHHAIANRAKLAIAQKKCLGKYIHLMNDQEQLRA
jgi:hypothetical protein